MKQVAKDEVFKQSMENPSDFKFDTNVVKVFDDMVTRSVPFYVEIQRMISELAGQYYIDETNIYDLGCSTGTTMMNLDKALPESIKFIGVDDSLEMLEKCNANLEGSGIKRAFELISADLNKSVEIRNASVVILCLTLQFVRPLYRTRLLTQIFDGLVSGGCIIIIEKILAEEPVLNRNFIKYYYDFKRRNEYSEMEISQKREALENVLVPYKLSENIDMLASSGFAHTEIFFKWYNFAGIIAQKN